MRFEMIGCWFMIQFSNDLVVGMNAGLITCRMACRAFRTSRRLWGTFTWVSWWLIIILGWGWFLALGWVGWLRFFIFVITLGVGLLDSLMVAVRLSFIRARVHVGELGAVWLLISYAKLRWAEGLMKARGWFFGLDPTHVDLPILWPVIVRFGVKWLISMFIVSLGIVKLF